MKKIYFTLFITLIYGLLFIYSALLILKGMNIPTGTFIVLSVISICSGLLTAYYYTITKEQIEFYLKTLNNKQNDRQFKKRN
jgi:hypothetical protein